jgi:hypothetical protein
MGTARQRNSRDLLLLWARAAGMCSHPDCKQRLVVEGAPGADATPVGEAAHIVAWSKDGPRGGEEIDRRKLNDYDNLILLCGHHHRVADKLAKTHGVEDLRAWKTEHEGWVTGATTVAGLVPWTVVVQEDGSRMDAAEAELALGAGRRQAGVVELRSEVGHDGWEKSAAWEWKRIAREMDETPAERRRFAVFSLGPIPLAVQLGYALGDRTRVELFQYDRDAGSWSWDEGAAGGAAVTWSAAMVDEGPWNEAAVRVSLSAEVRPEAGLRAGFEIDIRVAEPSVRWLRRREQLRELARVYGEVLAAIRGRGCRRVHLYYAGPAPGAVEFGRAYNPRMNPELVAYEYRRGESPSYARALVLNRG